MNSCYVLAGGLPTGHPPSLPLLSSSFHFHHLYGYFTPPLSLHCVLDLVLLSAESDILLLRLAAL